MRVIIMHETVTNHDAIGNDIELMYGILRERCDCKVFALNQFNRNVAYIDKDEMERIVDDPKQIAAKIDYWYAHREEARRMGKNGRKTLDEKHMDWDYVIDQLLSD